MFHILVRVFGLLMRMQIWAVSLFFCVLVEVFGKNEKTLKKEKHCYRGIFYFCNGASVSFESVS